MYKENIIDNTKCYDNNDDTYNSEKDKNNYVNKVLKGKKNCYN